MWRKIFDVEYAVLIVVSALIAPHIMQEQFLELEFLKWYNPILVTILIGLLTIQLKTLFKPFISEEHKVAFKTKLRAKIPNSVISHILMLAFILLGINRYPIDFVSYLFIGYISLIFQQIINLKKRSLG